MIVLDDKDSRVMYSDGWQAIGGELYNDRGEYGATHQNSLHATATDGAKMSFSFKGNYARIMGTQDFEIDSTGAQDPDWECTLDGSTIQKEIYHPSVANRWTFCAFLELPEGDHTIGLTVKTRGTRSILLDYVEYRSIGTVEDEVISASCDDSDLMYSELWPKLDNIARYTTNKGSSATFRFTGTGISMYAMYSAELSHTNGEATYSLDGGPSTTFIIPGGGDTTMFSRRIFEINNLSKEVHTIVITYASDSGSTPLVISHFFIEKGTNLRIPAVGGVGSSSDSNSANTNISGVSSSSPTLPSVDSDTAALSSKRPAGVIVGGVLGAITFSILLLLLTWRWRRKRVLSYPDDSDAAVRPFSMNHGTQGVTATATALLKNHPDNLPSVHAPAHHPAARSKHRPVSVQARICFTPPHPEVISTNQPLLLAHPRSVYHEDSGLRLPALETEDIIEHPPMYTVQ